MDKHALVAGRLKDIHAGWSIGSFGAIGEFHQRHDDVIEKADGTDLIRVTEKGGIRVDNQALTDACCLAYEALSRNPRRWSSEVIFCLPEDEAKMSGRDVITELGPDDGALRQTDRDAILFDMGLGLLQVDFCVRTEDSDLINLLRRAEGQSIVNTRSAAMAAILSSHPHRVVMSKLGQVEIYQKIGGAETGGVSPDGPHTHVLPKLIKTGRTHSSNTPVPDGYLPCLYLHPANPVMGPDGKDIPFQQDRYTDFQQIMSGFGDPDVLAIKQTVRDEIATNVSASDFNAPDSRKGRTALRVVLRQLLQEAIAAGDQDTESQVKSWQMVFDPNAADALDHSEIYEHKGQS